MLECFVQIGFEGRTAGRDAAAGAFDGRTRLPPSRVDRGRRQGRLRAVGCPLPRRVSFSRIRLPKNTLGGLN